MSKEQHVTIYTSDGGVQQTTTTDSETARYYENLPFTSENVVRVDVTVNYEENK